MIFLLFLCSVLSFACLGDTGTYVVNVRVYLDEDSLLEIAKFTKKLLHHNTHKKEDELDGLGYGKEYFDLIFKEINAQLLDTNIQLEADLSETLTENYRGQKEKLCVVYDNIENIVETFLSEFRVPSLMGENKILIINCQGNNAFMPSSAYISTRNGCGHVIGALLEDPSTLRGTILEGIYKVLHNNALPKAVEAHKDLAISACNYISHCNRHYEGTGMFVENMRSVGNVNELHAFEDNKNAIWSFGHAIPEYYAIEGY